MKHRLSAFALVTACAWLTSIAWAGMYDNAAIVKIDLVARTASGGLQKVRSTADSEQVIGCVAHFTFLQCEATQVTPVHEDATCRLNSTDPLFEAFLKPLLAIDRASFVKFTWDSNNKCTNIEISKGSPWLKA